MKQLLDAIIALALFFGVLFMLTFVDVYFHNYHLSRIIGTFAGASLLTVGYFRIKPILKAIRNRE